MTADEHSTEHRHVGTQTARKRLRLAHGHFPAALTAGLIVECHRGHVAVDAIEAASADPLFPLLAANAVELNAAAASAHAGVSVTAFQRAVSAGAISRTRVTPWKYGNSISWFRTGDVDALVAASWWTVDSADRVVAAVSNRALGAQKAAETRRLKAQARIGLIASVPIPGTDPFTVVAWGVGALHGLNGWWRSGIHADHFRWLPEYLAGDNGFDEVFRLVRQSRFNKLECGAWSNTARALLAHADQEVCPVETASNELGVSPNLIVEQMNSLADALVRTSDLQKLLADPPAWVTKGRIDLAILRIEVGERQAEAARIRDLSSQVSAAMPAFIPVEDVAQIFALPVDLVAQWRQHWSVSYVQNLQDTFPDWLRSETALRQKIELRVRSRASTKQGREQRQARRHEVKERRIGEWRTRWAQLLGVPIGQVPSNPGNPTTHAVKTVRENAPAWSLARP